MADLTSLYRRAVAGFAARVASIGDGQWGNATPCSDWDVRTLLNHVVGEHLWAVPLFDGATIAEVGDRFDGDVLGDDPKATWASASAASLEAVGAPGLLERTVHLSFGDTTADDYLSQLLTDHVIHAWDLARGIGGDEHLDPELVAAVHDYLSPRVDGWRAAGAFGASVDVPDDADLQTRLLAMTGRQS